MRRFRQWIATAVLSFSALAALAATPPETADPQVQAQVTAAEAVRSVKRLQNSLSQYQEWGLWQDIGDLFTANASAEFGAEKVSGSAAIRGWFMQQAGRKQAGLAKGQLNTQVVMQPIVTLNPDGRGAKATWHEFGMLGEYGKRAYWAGGIYENEYALDGGVWKISRIHYYPQYTGEYTDFGHKAPAKWNVAYHFEGKHVGVSVPEAALQSLAAAPRNLEGRLQRLEDETAVQNLQHSLGYYLDRKLWDDVADLFTAGGTLQFGLAPAARGAADIRSALQERYGKARLVDGELFDHILVSTVVTIAPDGRSAAARSLSIGQLGRNGDYSRWETGTFENSYVRDGGVWKLSQARYFPRMATDFDLGWARDAKIRLAKGYDSYPQLHNVGFGFLNPVSGKPVRWGAGKLVKVPVIPASGKSAAPGAVVAASSTLAQRAHAAIAIDAVENLNSSYGYYIDESDWDSMADTFGSMGSKEVTGAGVYVGTERIRTILKKRGPLGGRSPTFFTIHQLAQPVTHVAADGLSARSRLRLFQCGGNADGSSGSWIGGIYENTALYENGEWKFGDQDLHHLFNASYRNGWARLGAAALAAKPPPNPAIPNGGGIQQGLGGAARPAAFVAEFPPDRAIRSRQYAFPVITEPAFHYRNPVSGRMPLELLP